MTLTLLKDVGRACFEVFRLLGSLFCFNPVDFDFDAVMLEKTFFRSCSGSSFLCPDFRYRWPPER